LRFKYVSRAFLIVIIAILFTSCKSLYNAEYKKPQLTDKNVSKSVKILHKRLFYIAKKGFAIGHEDATAYGIGWKLIDDLSSAKSDVNDVAEDFPAVYGFDIGRIEHGHHQNIDSVDFNQMRMLIVDAHKSGGIITISWHVDNPKTGGDSWDQVPAVKDIINNGIHQEKYELWISKVADFIKTLTYKNKAIPIIFRPYHEMNGEWFWWGDPHCTAEDYITLWRNTVHQLRDKHGLHNLLYVYSPNKLRINDRYMKYYPGDEYVDIFGIDIYDFNNAEDYIKSVVDDITLMKRIATHKRKLYAFTETGLNGLQTKDWYSNVLYPSITNTGIAWVLFWRNYNLTHHYMPYKGHQSEDDFKSFKEKPDVLFLGDINIIKF